MPLSPNGKLIGKHCRNRVRSSIRTEPTKAPRGHVEQTPALYLASDYWGRQRSDVRIGSLFELGGHSILAVKCINEASKHGLSVTLSALFAMPELKALAAHIESDTSHGFYDRAIPLRTTGTQHPLFIIPEASGEMFYGPRLAAAIDADIPVYGLSGPDRQQPSFTTIEAAAARFATIIRRCNRKAPTGSSAGHSARRWLM
ncbi:phosphopantetheine-binding protein [Vibrio sp. PP-XX7]